VDRFPGVSYGIPRAFQLSLVGAGVLALLVAAFLYTRSRLPKGTTKDLLNTLLWSGVFLSIAAYSLGLFPALSVLVYLSFAVYLSIRFYELAQNDQSDGYLFVVMTFHVACFLGMVMAFLMVSPVIFGNLKIFYLLGLWEIVSSLIVTIVSCYTTRINKIAFYVKAGFLGWIANTVLFYSLLYGKGEMETVVYRMIVVHGHFSLIFVVLPLVTLIVVYGLAAYAAYFYFEWRDSDEDAGGEQKIGREAGKLESGKTEKKDIAKIKSGAAEEGGDESDGDKKD